MEAACRAILGLPNHFEFECPDPGALATIDCEQSDYHFDRGCRKANKGAKPGMFHAYRAAGASYEERNRLLDHVARIEGLRAIVLDGFADFCPEGILDPKPAADFIARLMRIASQKNCIILGVLHLNPSSDSKSRGHLGSELERKAETVLQISLTTNGEKSMWTPKARNQPIEKNEGIRFRWNDLLKTFETVPGTVADERRTEKLEKLTFLLRQVVGNGEGAESWTHAELSGKIEQIEGVTDRTARTRIKEMTAGNLLKRCQHSGNYISCLDAPKAETTTNASNHL